MAKDSLWSEMICPACGSDEHVSGRPNRDLIRLTCANCDVAWDRDPSPSCEHCGSRDVRPMVQAVIERSRGTQLSMVGAQTRYLCTVCDADLIAERAHTNTPLPPKENPAAGVK